MTAAYFEDHPTDPDKVILRKPQYVAFMDVPHRPWVGLTDEEKQEAYYKIDSWSECIAFIEARLKEKNS